jgi:hypothetical protein
MINDSTPSSGVLISTLRISAYSAVIFAFTPHLPQRRRGTQRYAEKIFKAGHYPLLLSIDRSPLRPRSVVVDL